MAITPAQKKLIEDSFETIMPRAGEFVQNFYQRLFEAMPEVRPLFKGNMLTQAGKLGNTIGSAVRSLEDPSELQPHLAKLGRRHVDFGVEERHYPIVNSVLLTVMGEELGDQWTQAHKEAWSALMTFASNAMIEGSKTGQSKPAQNIA